MDHHDTDQPNSFATIKFFSAFERKLRTFNKSPLVRKNLVIHDDAYKRLASSDDEDQSRDAEFFAEFEYGDAAKDSDLRFMIQFAAHVFVLHIEGVSTSAFGYEECFKDEDDAVRQIMGVLQLLASGQLAVLITEYQGKMCAAELLLYQSEDSAPLVLLTEAAYGRRWSKKDNDGYEAVLLRTKRLATKTTLPANFFLVDYDMQGQPMPKGRAFETAELPPLTKRLYGTMLQEVMMRQTGKRPDESESALILRSPEYWLLVLGSFSILYTLVAVGVIPRWLAAYPILLIPVLIVLSMFVLMPLLVRKEHLRAYHPDHWWIRADAVFQRFFVAPVRNFIRNITFWKKKRKKK